MRRSREEENSEADGENQHCCALLKFLEARKMKERMKGSFYEDAVGL